MGLLLAGSLTAGPADVKEIEVSFARSPVCGRVLDYPCPTPIVGAGGTLRFELLAPGTYTLEARKSVDAREDNRNVALTGNFAPFRDPRYPQLEIDTPFRVTGKTVDGNRLFAAGSGSGRGTLIFATTFTITAPVSFAGQLRVEDEVRIDARHLTFSAAAGGPQAPAQSVQIHNDSTSPIGYSVAFQSTGSTAWDVSLSNSAGTLPGKSSIGIEVRPPTGLREGTYHGFLRVKLQIAEGAREKVAALTLFVKPADSFKGTTLDAPMAVVYGLPNGGYEPGTIGITNHGATPVTYRTQVVSGATVTPASLTLAPGAIGSFSVNFSAFQTGQWVQICIPVLVNPSSGFPHVVIKCYWAWRGGAASAASNVCTGIAATSDHRLTAAHPYWASDEGQSSGLW